MKTKTIVLLVAVPLFIILLIQNSGSVQFNFFFWKIAVSQVILAPGIFFLGFAAGYWRAHFGRRRDRIRPAVSPTAKTRSPEVRATMPWTIGLIRAPASASPRRPYK